jgi:hypothetical protein
MAQTDLSGYATAKAKILASIHLGVMAEQDWDGPSIKPGELSDDKIEWLAAWLAGDGIS